LVVDQGEAHVPGRVQLAQRGAETRFDVGHCCLNALVDAVVQFG
jgi:hypothetical protein